MSFKWRVIINKKNTAAFNMAADEIIFKGVEANLALPTLRFYQWEKPTFSLGYNQNIAKEIDTQKVIENNCDYVRRTTGGRTVFHNCDLTYSICAPLSGKFCGGVTDTYAKISQALMQGLTNLGIKSSFEKGNLSVAHQRQVANPCFSSSSRYEISIDGKKIIGSAQLRTKLALLQHGSILFQKNQSSYSTFIPNISTENANRLSSILDKKTCCIHDFDNKITISTAIDAFLKGFMQIWNDDDFEIKNFTDNEIKQIKLLEKEKFFTKEWNFKK